MHSVGRWSSLRNWYHSGERWSPTRAACRAGVHREGIYASSSCSIWPQRHAQDRGRTANYGNQELRWRTMALPLHLCQRRGGHARGVVDDQRAAQDGRLAQGNSVPAPRSSHPRRDDRRRPARGRHGRLARGADGWFSSAGRRVRRAPPRLVATLSRLPGAGQGAMMGIREARKGLGVALAFYEAARTARRGALLA